MHAYGRRAQQAWLRLAPSAYARIPDPDGHFAMLGEEAQDQVGDLTTQLVGPDVPGETPGRRSDAGTPRRCRPRRSWPPTC
jgi:hypothetical protein